MQSGRRASTVTKSPNRPLLLLDRLTFRNRSLQGIGGIEMVMHGAVGGLPVHSARSSVFAPLLSESRSTSSHRRARSSQIQCSAQTLSRSYTGTNTAPPKRGHHFLHIDDFSKEELSAMLSTARTVKDKVLSGDNDYKPLAGKTMAMIFTKPSMRTRVSFETVRGYLSATFRACIDGITRTQV